jgi:hypothetical protein
MKSPGVLRFEMPGEDIANERFLAVFFSSLRLGVPGV